MRPRHGLTLVELLVSMALIVFIMAILSQAFVAATGTFRNLKAAGDLANKLRAVTQRLQHDLAADHFEGKKRISSPTFWTYGPPQQGFFRLWQGSAPSARPGSPCFIEGADLDGVRSYRTTDHVLSFTIKVRGNLMSDFLSASVPVLPGLADFGPPEARYQSGSYNYQWAEVAWFLLPSVDPASGFQDTTTTDRATGAPPVPLCTLYRRQRLAVPDNRLIPPQPASKLADFLEVSCWVSGRNLYFNSPMDLTVPARRFGMDPANPAGVPLGPYPTLQSQGAPPNLVGADIQLTDVISFDVRVLPSPFFPVKDVDTFVTLFDDPYFLKKPLNPSFGNAQVYDTWTTVQDGLGDYSQWSVPFKPTSIPQGSSTFSPGILAVQVTIRIWDAKTSQARQVTIIQAM